LVGDIVQNRGIIQSWSAILQGDYSTRAIDTGYATVGSHPARIRETRGGGHDDAHSGSPTSLVYYGTTRKLNNNWHGMLLGESEAKTIIVYVPLRIVIGGYECFLDMQGVAHLLSPLHKYTFARCMCTDIHRCQQKVTGGSHCYCSITWTFLSKPTGLVVEYLLSITSRRASKQRQAATA
jgi:hypothetical protein